MKGEERMEGVRILNEISSKDNIYLFIMFLGVILSIYFVVRTIIDFNRKGRIILIICIILSILLVIIIAIGNFFSPPQYEAIIDDNVKISEFEEKYKIIEKRGDIYVIEEIESDDK